MRAHKSLACLTLISAASASKSKWVEDFDGMLESVGCSDGPKDCGANNHANSKGQYCGSGRGCLRDEFSEWELCVDVAPWQCFEECDEGEVLSPLRYCKCIPASE